jgi:hypothetical protein
MTRRLAWYIFRSGCRESLAQVGRRVDLPESTVRAVFWRTAHDADLAFEPEAPAALGIDEVHLSGYAYGVFTDLKTSRVIDLLPGYSRSAIADALCRLRGYERIQVISMDYHGPYAAAVRDVYGDDRPAIVIDKRHILETARRAMNRVRIRTKTRMKPGTRRHLNTLMNSRPHKLSEGDRAYLAKALSSHPQLGQAYHLKETFYAIFARTNRAEAEAAFEAWAASIPKQLRARDFEPVVTTVRARWRDVFALFDWPGITNSKTENANGRINELHRQVRGFTRDGANDLAGFKAFRQMVLHAHGPRDPRETAVRIAARAVLGGQALATPRSWQEIEELVGGPVYWDAVSAGSGAVEVIDDLSGVSTGTGGLPVPDS